MKKQMGFLLICLFSVSLLWAEVIKDEKQKYMIKIPDIYQKSEELSVDNKLVYYFTESDIGAITCRKIILQFKVAQNIPLKGSYDIHKDDMTKNLKKVNWHSEKLVVVNELPAVNYRFEHVEDDLLRQIEGYCFQRNGLVYNVMFQGADAYYQHYKGDLETTVKTLDLLAFEPLPLFEFIPIEGWHQYNDEDAFIAYSKLKDPAQSSGEGILKIKIERRIEDISLQKFVTDLEGSKKTEKIQSSGISAILDLNGYKFFYFDLHDEEGLFIERYLATKVGRNFYVIYFMSSKENFEKELKLKLAGCLQSFKIKEEKKEESKK